MEKIYLREDYIKLGQALKACGLAGSGTDAKTFITGGEVSVNGQIEYRRGKKLKEGDIVEFNGEQILICK